jgi:hypothetical protein
VRLISCCPSEFAASLGGFVSNGNGTEQEGPKRAALRITLAGVVVLAGLGALVGAIALVLHHYPVVEPKTGQSGEDRSSAVVAVLTPIVAGVASVIGLYFGISATGSARGQRAQTEAQATQAATQNVTSATEAAASAAEAATSATETAKSAVAIASQVTEAATNGHTATVAGGEPTGPDVSGGASSKEPTGPT